MIPRIEGMPLTKWEMIRIKKYVSSPNYLKAVSSIFTVGKGQIQRVHMTPAGWIQKYRHLQNCIMKEEDLYLIETSPKLEAFLL